MTTTLIAFLVACNPANALSALGHDRRTDRPIPLVAGTLAAVAVIIALAGASQPILDLLGLNLGTFRVGAGVVLAVSGLRYLIVGSPKPAEEPATDFRLGGYIFFPTLTTPSSVVLAVSAGVERGTALTSVAAAICIVLGALGVYERRRMPAALASALVRLLGAGSVVIGVGLVVDGIKTL